MKQVWEMESLGIPPTGYSYGHELTDPNQIQLNGTDNPEQTHGTGVCGIAAGSGYGSSDMNRRCRGVAYESDLVFVGVRRDSLENQWLTGGFADFIDGISYIFNYAQTVSKPAVVNISWGAHSGPHDGSNLFNQACNQLSGPGRVKLRLVNKIVKEKNKFPYNTLKWSLKKPQLILLGLFYSKIFKNQCADKYSATPCLLSFIASFPSSQFAGQTSPLVSKCCKASTILKASSILLPNGKSLTN